MTIAAANQGIQRGVDLGAAVRPLLPGIALAGAVAGAAYLLRGVPGLDRLSPMILAIVLGALVRNTLGARPWMRAGNGFLLRRLLRLAVMLLGLQLTLYQLAAIGLRGLAVIVVTLGATFAVTLMLGRFLGVGAGLTRLIAAGTSICGASAVAAAHAATGADDADAAYAVATVTVFGTIAMFTYPLLADLAQLGARDYGLWAGASIHEVAQVVAAAFARGQEAGDAGTIAKLSRVTLLAPVVLLMGVGRPQGAGTAKAPVPWFVFGFLGLVVVASVVALPPPVKSAVATVDTVALTAAMAAMGLETDLRRLAAKGARPLLLAAVSSIFIAVFSLALIKLV